ncbi:MAG: neutral/alkaline non-lysosomal ceramidase N-terminal domain-containing protein [Pirellulaceae bacterium]|jgi:hypothetical protein|nr:neutral/alkaline non-lysosomal ceramidase N-terminal domain-containing protein [Pirellulaceae bacterium]
MKTRLTLLLLLLFLTPNLLSAAEFRAGTAVGDITPTTWPVYLVGSFSERGAEKAWDPLSARALVLDDGETRLAIVVVDSCLIPRSLFDDAKQRASKETGIRTDHMLMSATHTHSAPASLDRVFAKVSDAYLKVLKGGIVEAIKRANANLEPAEVGWGQVDVPEHVHNRRWHMKPGGIVPNPFGETTDQVRMNPPRGRGLLDRPAGPTDPQLSFISIRATTGRPIALLANYSLHYVGGVLPGGVSADYFGEFARQIKQRIAPNEDAGNPPFVGIMSNGTSGDINNINFHNPQPGKKPFEQIRYVANSVADEVLQAYKKTKHRESITLAMAQRELTLDIRKPTAKQLALAKQFLAEPDESKLPPRAKAYAEFGVRLAEMPPTEDIILQAIRIGDVGIASIPCEVFAEIGLDIKDRSPLKTTFTIELANGWNRYLPTPRQHRLGGYETWLGTNMLEIHASEKIEHVVLDLLNDVSRGEPKRQRDSN